VGTPQGKHHLPLLTRDPRIGRRVAVKKPVFMQQTLLADCEPPPAESARRSQPMNVKLPEGHFYGRIGRSIKLNGLILTESIYSPGFTTPRHSHEQGYFCLVLKGTSSQTYAAKNRTLKPFITYYYPPAEVHSDSYDKAGPHGIAA
jgi:hypothetical protein